MWHLTKSDETRKSFTDKKELLEGIAKTIKDGLSFTVRESTLDTWFVGPDGTAYRAFEKDNEADAALTIRNIYSEKVRSGGYSLLVLPHGSELPKGLKDAGEPWFDWPRYADPESYGEYGTMEDSSEEEIVESNRTVLHCSHGIASPKIQEVQSCGK